MKKIVMISVAASALLMAGGDIAPVEPVVETPVVTPALTGFYVGAAYGYMNEQYTRSPEFVGLENFDQSFNSFMMLAGYEVNQYIAVEARYWYGRGSDMDVVGPSGSYTIAGRNIFGIYAKPQYPVTDKFDVYALLGYAYADTNSQKLNQLDGFSWGLGASYDVRENIALFVDYTSIYDDDHSVPGATKSYTVDGWNFGVTYKF